jgi:hypothetical protein
MHIDKLRIEKVPGIIYAWDGHIISFNIYNSDKYRRLEVQYCNLNGEFLGISLRLYRNDRRDIEIGSEHWKVIKKILERLSNYKHITIKKYNGSRVIIDEEAVKIIYSALKELKEIKDYQKISPKRFNEEELEKKLKELGFV